MTEGWDAPMRPNLNRSDRNTDTIDLPTLVSFAQL
jgi:hypothetical protein